MPAGVRRVAWVTETFSRGVTVALRVVVVPPLALERSDRPGGELALLLGVGQFADFRQ